MENENVQKNIKDMSMEPTDEIIYINGTFALLGRRVVEHLQPIRSLVSEEAHRSFDLRWRGVLSLHRHSYLLPASEVIDAPSDLPSISNTRPALLPACDVQEGWEFSDAGLVRACLFVG